MRGRVKAFGTMQSLPGKGLDELFGDAAAEAWAVSDPWVGLEYLALREGVPLPPRAPTSGAEAATASDSACAAVSAASSAANAAAVLSANDALDDLPTRSLRFVLLPYMAACARAAWQGEKGERLDALIDARRGLVYFFDAVDNLGLLPDVDRDRVLDSMPELVQSGEQRREALIARYRAEKESAAKLDELLARRAARSGAGNSPDANEGDDADEEEARNGMVTIIQSALRRGMDDLVGIDREIEVLRYAVTMEARGIDPREKAELERPKGPPPGMNGLPSTFQIVHNREEARAGVFRPDTSLPTYTVEQWGEIEMKRAMEAEMEKRGREEIRARARAGEDSDGDEAADRETYEKRNWDKFTDEHNKGSGNSMR
jgi:immunoglobulin-binding protein 1